MDHGLCRYLNALNDMYVNIHPGNWSKGELDLTFKWRDAFKTSSTHIQRDYSLEKASVMWNLAASICEEACKMDRSTTAGLERASIAYQVNSVP